MSGPIARRAALLSFMSLYAAVESAPPAHAQAAPPPTMHGFYRYQVRGLTAGAGMFSGLLFKGAGLYHAAAHRMLPGFFRILSGVAKVSNDPSTKEMHDFLRSGDLYNLDLSTIPVTAGYGIEIQFTLELVKKEWRLKRGSYRWSSDHHFSMGAGEGSIVENVRGQGNGVLDPRTSFITLANIGTKRSPRLDLSGNIVIASGLTAGKSVYTSGPIRWAYDHGKGEVEIVMGGLAAMRDKLPGGNEPAVSTFSFSKSGPPERVVKGREVYQDLMDSGVVEEWELWDECDALIESPQELEELVYNDKDPGQLEHIAFASVRPSFWEDGLQWILPQIAGSEHEPQEPEGNNLDIVYTRLPRSNSEFGYRQVTAEFGPKAKAAGCKDPKPIKAGYFFPRDGTNHGGPPGPKSDDNPDRNTPNPNWFHYWMQTKASAGLPGRFIRYGGQDTTCLTAAGYYDYGDNHIVLCHHEFFIGTNPLLPGFHPEGIDYIAQVVLHEREHYLNYWRWWPKGYDPELDTDELDLTDDVDTDTAPDGIPDLLESSLTVPPEVKVPPGARFDPQMHDSFGYGIDDEHYFAYAAELRWPMGSANQEDGACPGKQAFTGPCEN